MKNYFNPLKKLAVAALLFSATFACTTEEDIQPKNTEEVPADVIAQLEKLGFPTNDVSMTQKTDDMLDPAYESGNYLVNGELVITPEYLEQMAALEIKDGKINAEQYRSQQLVSSSPRTLRVLGYTGGSQALDNTMRTALQQAISEYNALGLSLTFTLTFGTNYSGADIIVYKSSGTAGGSSGYPSGGNPYQYLQIYAGTSAYGLNLTKYVVMHELGHTIGMMHTDPNNSSCGGSSGGTFGGIHIPGTPTGTDPNSIFQACFTASATGTFSNYDIVALQYLY
jgi:hypothetical protein